MIGLLVRGCSSTLVIASKRWWQRNRSRDLKVNYQVDFYVVVLFVKCTISPKIIINRRLKKPHTALKDAGVVSFTR